MKGCFPLIARLDIDVVKSPVDIQLSKVASFLDFSDQFEDQRKQILILDSCYIESYVILY